MSGMVVGEIRIDVRRVLRDRARDAVAEVLKRHGYDIPGIADLCAGAALAAVGVEGPGC